MKDEKAEILPHSCETEMSRNLGWNSRVGMLSKERQERVGKCVLSLEFQKIETELTEPASCVYAAWNLFILEVFSPGPLSSMLKNSPEEKEKKSFHRQIVKSL